MPDHLKAVPGDEPTVEMPPAKPIDKLTLNLTVRLDGQPGHYGILEVHTHKEVAVTVTESDAFRIVRDELVEQLLELLAKQLRNVLDPEHSDSEVKTYHYSNKESARQLLNQRMMLLDDYPF